MTIVFLLYLAAPFALLGLLYLSGIRSKRLVLAIPAGFYLLPVVMVAGLYLFRTPIQQGKVLADLGPMLNLVFPAPDLYLPLATVELKAGQKEYTLHFSHKYVGMHAVKIAIPGRAGMKSEAQDLRVSWKVFDGDHMLLEAGPAKGSRFWGKDDHGNHFLWYRVPRDLPAGKQLTARVIISGDLSGYLKKRPSATLSVTKLSDE